MFPILGTRFLWASRFNFPVLIAIAIQIVNHDCGVNRLGTPTFNPQSGLKFSDCTVLVRSPRGFCTPMVPPPRGGAPLWKTIKIYACATFTRAIESCSRTFTDRTAIRSCPTNSGRSCDLPSVGGLFAISKAIYDPARGGWPIIRLISGHQQIGAFYRLKATDLHVCLRRAAYMFEVCL